MRLQRIGWMIDSIVCRAVCLGEGTGDATGVIIIVCNTGIIRNLAVPKCHPFAIIR